MPWKLHVINDVGVYNDLRYNRIRFLEQVRGEPAFTPYPDPGKHGRADIGIAFQIDANWNEILGGLGFDLRDSAPQTERI